MKLGSPHDQSSNRHWIPVFVSASSDCSPMVSPPQCSGGTKVGNETVTAHIISYRIYPCYKREVPQLLTFELNERLWPDSLSD
jgi:hypothetical protein